MQQFKSSACFRLNNAIEKNYRDQTRLAHEASRARNRLITLRGELSEARQRRDTAKRTVEISGPSARRPTLGNTVAGAMGLAVAAAALREAEMQVDRILEDISFQEHAVDAAERADRAIADRISMTLQELRDENC